MNRSGLASGMFFAVMAGAALSGCGSSTASSSSSSGGGGTAPTINAGGGSASFCVQAVGLAASIGHVGTSFISTSPGATPDINVYKALIAKAASTLDAIANAAPSEISAAFQTLRTAYDQASTQIQSATSFEQLGSLATTFEAPAVKTASDQITAYMQNSCGFKSTPTP